MPNPLADRGFSDRDYSALVGTLVGEVAVNGKIQDFQAIADVVANRLNDPAYTGQFGRTVTGQVMNPNQFSTWSKNEKHAYANAQMGFVAALNPSRVDRMPAAVQERIGLAKQAVADVFDNGKARGLTQGATAYHNPDVTAALGTGGWHNRLENQYGAVTIGDHRFTGKGLRDEPFDPIQYNGQLAPPEAAVPDWSGVAMDTGQRTRYDGAVQAVPSGAVSVSDLAPIPSGFDFAMAGQTAQYGEEQAYGAYTPEARMDQATFDSITNAAFGAPPDYSSITAGMYPSLESFQPSAAAQPDFSDVHIGLTEQQAIDRMGLTNQRPSENVEIQRNPMTFGVSIDEQVARQEQAALEMDQIAVDVGQLIGRPDAVVNIDPNNLGISTGTLPESTTDYSDITAGILHDAPPAEPVAMAEALRDAGLVSAPKETENPYGGLSGFGKMVDDLPSYSAGFKETTPTPDFNAPSLVDREKQALSDYRQDQFERGNWAKPVENDINRLNDALMAELAPAQEKVAEKLEVAAKPAPVAVNDDPFGFTTQSIPAVPAAVPAVPVAPSVAPQRPAPAPAPAPVQSFRAPAPVQAPVQPAVQAQPAQTAPQPQQSNPFGFANVGQAMDAIGSGRVGMPGGYNEAWGRTAFSDSVYAGAAYNDLMDAVAKDTGLPGRQGLTDGIPSDVKSALTGGLMGGLTGGPFGALVGATDGYFGISSAVKDKVVGAVKDLLGNGSNGSSFGGFSIGDVTSADGYNSIGVGIDNFMGGLSGGGGFGSLGGLGGMTGEMGGYGNADGSPSNNSPGTWG